MGNIYSAYSRILPAEKLVMHFFNIFIYFYLNLVLVKLLKS